MKVAEFDFELPPERIAQHPANPRDAARLLDVGKTLVDRVVSDLPQLLKPEDLLVYNDTRVIKAKLYGKRGAASVDITLHKAGGDGIWQAFARPAKKLRAADTIDFAPGFSAEVLGKGEGGEVTLKFALGPREMIAALDRHGHMPLPPYIKRSADNDAADVADYQTIWGIRPGAVAASTAGFHFTPRLLQALESAGIRRTSVTLHVGAGTFLPVKVADTQDHRMHVEWGEIGAATVEAIATARARGGRIIAVGTTALRVLETVARDDGILRPWSGETDIFITPGFRFRVADMLLTNFHLPRSTLFMLVAAFAGLERMRQAYVHAIRQEYRFYSYGDCCLLRRADS
jgi:S-adenosylmethionine:tRNA ribosyltransferase-isomerase